MQINKIQNSDTVFGAKINIIGKRFDENFIKALNKKAKQIGLENDIIELKYTNFKRTIEDYHYNQGSCRISGYFDELTENFKARFIPEDHLKGTKKIRDKFYADNYTELWKQEEEAANNYLDKLIKQYAS